MTATTRLFITAGALGCMAGVITGAFGAHALEQALSPDRLQTWGKGVDYLFVHALGLILLGILETAAPKRCHRVAGGLMMAGILLFSGSLYTLALTGIRGIGKTTTARIIAKGMNCIGPDGQGGPTTAPCGVCR